MNKSVVILSVLLLAALIGSYLSWTATTSGPDPTGVVLLDVAPDDVASFAYKADGFQLTVERRSDDRGSYFWGKSERTRQKDGKPEEQSAEFKVGGAVDGLLTQLAPFVAVRALDAPPAGLAEFGLEEPDGHLSLAAKGKNLKFAIGKEGYGHRNFYVQDEATKKLYLLDGKVLRSIRQGDSRLLERRLTDLEVADLRAFAVASGDSTSRFVQANASDPAKAFWTKEGSEERDVPAKIWIAKVLRARSTAYVDEKAIVGATVALTLTLEGAKSTSKIELLHAKSSHGMDNWYARSPFTRGNVKLPTAIAVDLVEETANLGLVVPEGLRQVVEPTAPATAPPVPATPSPTTPSPASPASDPHAGHSHGAP